MARLVSQWRFRPLSSAASRVPRPTGNDEASSDTNLRASVPATFISGVVTASIPNLAFRATNEKGEEKRTRRQTNTFHWLPAYSNRSSDLVVKPLTVSTLFCWWRGIAAAAAPFICLFFMLFYFIFLLNGMRFDGGPLP